MREGGKRMTIDEKLDLLLKQSEDTNNKISCIEDKLNSVESKVNNLEDKLNSVESNISSLELTLENETNKNIQIIADGHLDLGRKLDDTLKIENEKEMLLIRVNSLENEVRKIKDRLSQIA